MLKFRGCAIFQTRVIRQKVSLKITGFSMETPCWSPSEGLQHGDRKPVETSGVYFGSLKTFIIRFSCDVSIFQNEKLPFYLRFKFYQVKDPIGT